MMDPLPLVSEIYHPILDAWNYDGAKRRVEYYLRTGHPTRYYFIDFGISRRYSEDCKSPREPQIMGGDRSVPEFQDSVDPCDPFPTDIYYLGNLLRKDILQVRSMCMLATTVDLRRCHTLLRNIVDSTSYSLSL